MKRKLNVFVGIISVLSVISSLVGLFYQYHSDLTSVVSVNGQEVELYQKGLYYRDSVSVAAQGIASDFITLVIAVPVLLFSLYLFNKESFKGKVLLTGMLGYFLYTYVSYVFLWNYNFMFLVYVALMSLSLFTFTYLLSTYNVSEIKHQFTSSVPRKWIGGYQIAIGLFMTMMWLSTIVTGLLENQTPELLEHYTTLVIQALDLGIVIPVAFVSGILLIKNQDWGYVLSSVVVVKGTMMLIAIFAMIINQLIEGVAVELGVLVVFGGFTLLSIFILFMLLRSTKEAVNIQ